MTQLGLYVGLFQLFVADKISHKGCFTQQARCPEMCVFLAGVGLGEPPRGTGHEGRHWRSWEMVWSPHAQVAGARSVPRCLRALDTQALVCLSPRSTRLQPPSPGPSNCRVGGDHTSVRVHLRLQLSSSRRTQETCGFWYRMRFLLNDNSGSQSYS